MKKQFDFKKIINEEIYGKRIIESDVEDDDADEHDDNFDMLDLLIETVCEEIDSLIECTEDELQSMEDDVEDTDDATAVNEILVEFIKSLKNTKESLQQYLHTDDE